MFGSYKNIQFMNLFMKMGVEGTPIKKLSVLVSPE
jgi:hypothetical protein